MFREMRRSAQQLSDAEDAQVLARNTHGVLAVAGENGYPYAVPLSYVYCDGVVYFHCACTGHKLDAIAAEPRVSFAVVDSDAVVGSEFTTRFRSVILFGRASVVTNEEERQRAMRALCAKYCADETPESIAETIDRSGGRTAIVRVDIDHITGKEAIELRRQK